MPTPLKYRPEFCEIAVNFLSQGYTLTALAAELDVTRETVDQWRKKYPEFGTAINKGYAKAQRFFEQRLILMAKGDTSDATEGVRDNVNMTALIFTLKTRFHKYFGNKQTIEHTGKVETGPDVSKLSTKDLKELEKILAKTESDTDTSAG